VKKLFLICGLLCITATATQAQFSIWNYLDIRLGNDTRPRTAYENRMMQLYDQLIRDLGRPPVTGEASADLLLREMVAFGYDPLTNTLLADPWIAEWRRTSFRRAVFAAFRDNVDIARGLRTEEDDRRWNEVIALRERLLQAERFRNSDLVQLREVIRRDFVEWARQGEFERAEEHQVRLGYHSVAGFYAITFDRLAERVERRRENRGRTSDVRLGTYNADQEYFPVRLGEFEGVLFVPLENAQHVAEEYRERTRRWWSTTGVSDWHFNNNTNNLEPRRALLTVGRYGDMEVLFSTRNTQPIEIAFSDLGIENAYAQNAVFNDNVNIEASRNMQYFASSFDFFRAFLCEEIPYEQTLKKHQEWVRKTTERARANNCNGNIIVGRFYGDLGTVGFRTNRVWRVGNQEWSDAVTATACQKSDFVGQHRSGRDQVFSADCRSNPEERLGDLFSWCAVVAFADVLCPYPWRVPRVQDFIDLDIAFGGTGQNRFLNRPPQMPREASGTDRNARRIRETYEAKIVSHNNITSDQFIMNNYGERWGSFFGGYFSGSMTHSSRWVRGNHATYWSLSGGRGERAGALELGRWDDGGGIITNRIVPNSVSEKRNGLPLRCVRNVE